jgi:tripartite-type tricarboxylate transporter receptor subunit TctC
MMSMHVFKCCTAALLAAVFATPLSAAAQAEKYPNRPIRMLVPFAPGGGTDITARLIAANVTAAFGQQVIVDNRAGGGGTIGAETAVRAAPDGYTIIMVSGSYGTNAALYKLPYDPVKDIQPIVMIGDTGTQMTHIPYKGTGPALADLIGGQVQLIFGAMPATLPHVRSGKLRGLGVSTAKRSNAIPELPAVSEVVKDYEAVLWYGLWGPKGLPKPIIARWNQEVAKALQTDELKKRLAADGTEPAGGPPEQFLAIIARDVEKWRRVVKAANVKVSS